LGQSVIEGSFGGIGTSPILLFPKTFPPFHFEYRANDQSKSTTNTTNDYTANTSVAAANESLYAALPKLQRDIMELVAKDDTDEGMHVSTISRAVSGNGKSSGEQVM
jgi:hypothetical protein